MSTRKTPKRRNKRRSTKTPEQRQAEIDALKQAQADAIHALTTEQAWVDWLKAGRLFRSYSLNNVLLILAQCPEATRVAGFKVWNELGRKITSGKGSALKIWGKPYHPTRWVGADTVDETNTRILERDGDQVKVRSNYTRCPIVSVFDVSQTDGDPLPEVAARLADDNTKTTAQAAQVIALLNAWLTTDGWEIEVCPLGMGVNGATNHSAKIIRLAEGLTTTQTAKTLIHEAAHAVLHADDTWVKISEYHNNRHRGVAEIQAESVAFIVAGMCGLDTSGYSTGYVADWARRAARSEDTDAILAAVENTAKAVHTGVNIIMDALEGGPQENTPGAGIPGPGEALNDKQGAAVVQR